MLKKLNTPFPQTLPKECAKAAKIFQSFVDSGNNGLDGVVPRKILENAKGFAIFSVVKAGFVFSARAGSGIVIARLEDGAWSAPSAIGTAGLGIGGQAGAEVTDFLIVLNSRSALRSFMAAGSITLGGNLSVAVGPLGRNGEAIGSLSTSGRLAAMYSYSKTRGLFGGVSLEGSVIVERQDANAQAYHSDNITVKTLLSGAIPPPDWALPLVRTLEQCTGLPGGRKWVDDRPRTLSDDPADSAQSRGRSGSMGEGYIFGGLASPGSVGSRGQSSPGVLSKKKKKGSGSFPPGSWGKQKTGGSYFDDAPGVDEFGARSPPGSPLHDDPGLSRSMAGMSLNGTGKEAPLLFDTHFESDFATEERMRQHPPLSNKPPSPPTNTNKPISTGDLLDLSEHYPSPLSFDPLGYDPTRAGTMSKPHFPMTPPDSPSPSRSVLAAHAQPRPPLGFTSNAYSATTMPVRSQSASLVKPRPAFARSSTGSLSYLTIDGDTSQPARAMTTSPPQLKYRPELSQPLPSYAVGRAVASFDFKAVEPGDLSFNSGQVITILEKSNTTDAWWKGTVDGRTGIFPANFVEMV